MNESITFSKWQCFASVLLCACVSGTPYAFGIFSEVLKEELSFNQVKLSVIGSCGSAGLYTGVLNGLGLERFGPRTVLCVGSFLVFAGNFYVWLAVNRLVWHSVPAISIAYFFAQAGIACAANTATVVAIRVFPTSITGQAAGLAKGYFGVSSAVLATVSAEFFESTSSDFIIFVALMLPVVHLFSACNVNFIPAHIVSFSYELSRGYSPSLLPYSLHLVGLFGVILLVGAIHHWTSIPAPLSILLGCGVSVYILCLLLLPPLHGPRCVPEADLHCREIDSSESAYGGDSSDTSLLEMHDMSDRDKTHPSILHTEKSDVHKEYSHVEVGSCIGDGFVSFYGRHLPLSETVCTWRCYMLMTIFMCIAGSGLLVINNIQAIAEAVDEEPSAFFVTILSLANAGGRLLVGVIADHYMHAVSRLQLLVVISLIMACTQLLLSTGSSVLLYPCLLMVGINFGATFSNMAAIASDIFGAQYVGSNYGFIDIAPAIGSYIFSSGLVALFYPTSHGRNGGASDIDSTCRGAHCFRTAFHITTLCCIGTAVLSYFMHVTTPLNKNRG